MLRNPSSSAACVISMPRPKTTSELSAEGLWSRRNVPNSIRAASLLSGAGRSGAGRTVVVLLALLAAASADGEQAAGTADAQDAADAPDAEDAPGAADAQDAARAADAQDAADARHAEHRRNAAEAADTQAAERAA